MVSPNAPVRQIWVSAHSKSFKLDWDAAKEAFVLREWLGGSAPTTSSGPALKSHGMSAAKYFL